MAGRWLVPIRTGEIAGRMLALLMWVTCANAAARADEPTARFDWSVPARFTVPGLASAETPYEVYTEELHPDSWPVDFDACESTGGVAEYRWAIDGIAVGSAGACDGFSWSFPSEGSHVVTLTVAAGDGAEASTTIPVVVQDLLIFGLGDSYGSGEGAPDEPVPLEAISFATAKQAAVGAASAGRDAAVASYLDALAAYQIREAQLVAVLAALNRFQRAKAEVAESCPLPVIACSQANAELADATSALLLALSRAGLGALDIDQPNSIRDVVDDLRTLGQAALAAAAASRDAAVAALAAAEADLAAARAALQPVWQNRRCHRSSHSAQARAARLLEERDPHSSVTFVHLSCSGGTVAEGVVGPYAGIEGGSPSYPPQLARVGELALVDVSHPELGAVRPVDAIVLSVGGNDVNFGSIIQRCITFASCPTAPVLDQAALAARAIWCAAAGLFSGECVAELGLLDTVEIVDAEQLFQVGEAGTGLDDLPANYESIAAGLELLGLDAGPLYLTEYPDITRDENGDTCGWTVGQGQENLIGIDSEEMAWADAGVSLPLGVEMRRIAGELGWRFVDGVRPLFRRHGYCSAENWVVRIQEAFAVEGRYEGGVHPNDPGQAAWAELIARAVPEPGASGAAAVLSTLAALARRRTVRRLRAG